MGALMQIHTLDLEFQGVAGVIAAYLVECEGELALIETGPESCRDTLLKRLGELKVMPEDVRKVLLTHIHLDHAGGAGWWAAENGSEVFCHPKAARHLVDPSRLVDSARQIYQDRIDELWGDVVPAPKGKVTVLEDGATLSLGNDSIEALDTPGHARHHHAYAIGGACFAGDVAGVRLPGSRYLSVASAPPQFDPVAYAESINRLKDRQFEQLFLTHFGEVEDIEAHLYGYAERVNQCHQYVAALRSEGEPTDELTLNYVNSEHDVAKSLDVSEKDWQRYELANGTAMCAAGIELYVSKA